MKCKDCKFWEKGFCSAAEWFDEHQELADNEFGFYVYAYDDSGLCVDIRTGPEFGCVNFEVKKSKNNC